MQDHGVGKEGVQAHARREGDRVVGDQAHGRRADGSCQTGGDKHRALVHAGLAEDARVDEQNVGHGQKGRDARQNLGPHVGVVCLELKQPFQHVCSPWRAGRRECIDLNSKAQAAERAWKLLWAGKSRASYQ
ncbi:hypothetical protein D3C78_997230 [compost metagenome]